jgi:hypothetical protein
MNIQLTVLPSEAAAPGAKGTTVEATYHRSVNDAVNAESDVLSTVRFEIDEGSRGSAILEDAATPEIRVAVLAIDGSALLTRAITAKDGKAACALSAADLQAIIAGPQSLPTIAATVLFARTARFVSTGGGRIDFAKASVMVTPVVERASLASTSAAPLLAGAGATVSSLEVTGQDLLSLSQLSWSAAHLSVDGTLTASFRSQTTVGWVWWLIGSHQLLGFVSDDLATEDRQTRVIPLPALASPAGGYDAPHEHEHEHEHEHDADCGRKVPADVSEAEVANNPNVYTEDPGAFCRPFSSPERVLGERMFSVIARVTQPAIGARGSIKTRTLSVLNLEGDTAPPPPAGGGRRARTRPVAVLEAAPVATLPVRHPLPGNYESLLRTLPASRAVMDSNHPLQWEDDIAQYQAATVAIGHILDFRVRWRSNGYSLGNVAKTLTLAPRQVKRIQKIAWERTERTRRSESTRLRDRESDSLVSERDYYDSVTAHLSEWARGGSQSGAAGIAGGIGFFTGGVLGAIGGGAGSAHSSSHQNGGRDATATERQRLRDSIRRHGDALRHFESTVVNEVTQEENVTGTTEVIRNPNYAHALTVIYYQILRHLKVSTEFAGARECLFVPFAIKPFDVARAYRWRESLQAAIRSPLYSRALRYLKDVATNFTTSDIPPGPRANQRLTYLRGSIYLDLAIERPPDAANGAFDAAAWSVLQPLLGTPALGIFNALLAQNAAARDRAFQTSHAPGIAAKWADRLTLRVGSRVLNADCTLASRYEFNRGVRVDFAVPSSELSGLTRASLQQLRIAAGQGLPPGSVANLTRLSLTYNTDRFEHGVEARTGTNDLVAPETGASDSASVVLPLDDWERVDERLEITRSVAQLVEHLNEHVEYYHKAIWWHMDRDRLLMLLDGFYVPNTNNVSIASIVDREPIGIIGNSLIYRVGAASFLGIGRIKTPADLYDLYASDEPVNDPLLVSLPTDGLYAQTIMDECAALEEHYGNTDWVLNQAEPDLGTIDPSLLQTRRTDATAATTPTAFPSTIINLQNAPEAPPPSGVSGVLGAVTTANAFRDMAGLAGTQANAMGALNAAADLAKNFGNQAAALEMAKIAKAEQATRTADQKLASIRNAVDKGLSDPVSAVAQANDVLAAMNPDSHTPEAPHQNPAINDAITAAKTVPGSTVEANTTAGTVKVTMGETAPAATSPVSEPGPATLSPATAPSSIVGVMSHVSRGLTAHPHSRLTLSAGQPQTLSIDGHGWKAKFRCTESGTAASDVTHPLDASTGDDHTMTVFSKIDWDAIQVSGGFAGGAAVTLPLTSLYLSAFGSQKDGTINNPSHPFFRTLTRLDRASQFLFGFIVSADGSVAPLPVELAEAHDFRARVLGTGGDLPDSSVVVLLLVELALCRPVADYDPWGAANVARYYPTTTTWSSKPLDEVRTVTSIARPVVTQMDMESLTPGRQIRSALYADMNGDINLVPDGSPLDSATPPLPRWDWLFAHYRVPSSAAGQTFEVVGQKPARTDSGNRRYWGVTGSYVPTSVNKVSRQGVFDNIHVAPAMLYAGAGTTPPNAYMAPVCQHDCLHTHWRWADSFTPRQTCGWGPGGPNTVPGAPMVPLNQTVEISVNGAGNAFVYRAIARGIPANAPQLVFHHGGGYATGLAHPLAANVGVGIAEIIQRDKDLLLDPTRPPFMPSWASLYFHNRWIWSHVTHGYVTRLDESNFASLEAL